MPRPSNSSRRPRKHRKSRKISDKNSRFMAYNTLASRPLSNFNRSLVPQITAQLRTSGLFLTTSAVAATTFASQSFTINNLDGFAEYLGLFDQYRFDQIEVWIEPTGAPQGTTAFNSVVSCVDLDDASVPTTYASVAAHQCSVETNGAAGHYHRWKPHVAMAAYAGTFVGFGNSENQWIDSASNTVQHYGIKMAALGTAVAVAYDIFIRAVISFRAPGI
jgi:hypothetical protein